MFRLWQDSINLLSLTDKDMDISQVNEDTPIKTLISQESLQSSSEKLILNDPKLVDEENQESDIKDLISSSEDSNNDNDSKYIPSSSSSSSPSKDSIKSKNSSIQTKLNKQVLDNKPNLGNTPSTVNLDSSQFWRNSKSSSRSPSPKSRVISSESSVHMSYQQQIQYDASNLDQLKTDAIEHGLSSLQLLNDEHIQMSSVRSQSWIKGFNVASQVHLDTESKLSTPKKNKAFDPFAEDIDMNNPPPPTPNNGAMNGTGLSGFLFSDYPINYTNHPSSEINTWKDLRALDTSPSREKKTKHIAESDNSSSTSLMLLSSLSKGTSIEDGDNSAFVMDENGMVSRRESSASSQLNRDKYIESDLLASIKELDDSNVPVENTIINDLKNTDNSKMKNKVFNVKSKKPIIDDKESNVIARAAEEFVTEDLNMENEPITLYQSFRAIFPHLIVKDNKKKPTKKLRSQPEPEKNSLWLHKIIPTFLINKQENENENENENNIDEEDEKLLPRKSINTLSHLFSRLLDERDKLLSEREQLIKDDTNYYKDLNAVEEMIQKLHIRHQELHVNLINTRKSLQISATRLNDMNSRIRSIDAETRLFEKTVFNLKGSW